MSLTLPAQHPTYVFRTAGGLYLSTRQQWGKATALRNGYVRSEPNLRPHGEELQVELGFSPDSPHDIVRQQLGLDDVRPGMQSLTFQGVHLRDWVHTSEIISTHAGISTSTFREGKPHLLFGLDAAWYVDPTGTSGLPLLGYGWDGAVQPVDVDELYAALSCPRFLRIAEESTLQGTAEFVEAAPGWAPFVAELELHLNSAAATLIAVHRDQASRTLPTVRVDSLTLNDEDTAETVSVFVRRFHRAIQSHCAKCGAPDENVRLIHMPVGEVLHFVQLCTACAAEVHDATR